MLARLLRRPLLSSSRTCNPLSSPFQSHPLHRSIQNPLLLLSLRPRFLCSPSSSNDGINLRVPKIRTKTPLEKQFEFWVQKLKPGFSPSDVDEALRAQSDPDLALDLFRWTGLQRGYKHNDVTYHTMIQILMSSRRNRVAETLAEEVVAGACGMSLPLYNTVIRLFCNRDFLFNRAFDLYKKLLESDDCKPNLETYTMLFDSTVRKFRRLKVSYVYLHSVRMLTKQMKAVGVIPDRFVLNLIIKAHCMCLEVDDALRILREMGLYGCQPNGYSYGHIVKALCEKGRVGEGLVLYREMRDKRLVPSGNTHMILICSLALDRRFEEAVDVCFEMLGNFMAPDLLTYRTLLEELCRAGRDGDAFDLLDELKKRDKQMNKGKFQTLLDALYTVCRE